MMQNNGAVPEAQAVRVRFDGKITEYDSYRAASDAWSRYRDESGLGASEMPGTAEIVDPQGSVVAYISYNGRVWPGKPRDWHVDLRPIYDNRVVPVPFEAAPALAAQAVRTDGHSLTEAARTGYFGNPNPHAPDSHLWLAHALGQHLHGEGYPPPADVRVGLRQDVVESRGIAFQSIKDGAGVRFERDFNQLTAEPEADVEEGPRP